MQQVLNKYKDRLINISSRNRSLVMKKLYKKNSFDFQSLSRFTTGIDSAILEFLLGRRLSKIRLLPDKNAYEEQLAGEYREQIDNKFWEGKKLLLQTVFDSVELSAKERELREKCDRELDEKLEIGRKQADEISEIFGSINYLNREINAIEKETGRYELYAGYPFVEGRFKDGTFVKAPLLLFPVRLLREGDNWLIDNIEEQYILLNKVFLMAFEKYNEIRLKELETEFYDLKEAQIDTAEGLLKYLGDAGISIKAGSGRRIERFQEFSEADEAVYRPGELSAKNYLVLGRFPIANNSIYNDYTALEKEEIQNKLLDKLLLNSDKEQSIQTGREVEAGGIREEDFYFMTPLDYSQEKALKSVNGTEQLVIYGPPGTGKSQTIANMISDGLAKGRKILMVSQKRAALDVIYNRISNLSSKVVIIHDSEKDKKAFYMKTAGLLEETGSRDVSDLMARIKEKSVRIDEDIKILDKLGELLHREREFGLTLQQMYVKSVKIASKEDPRFEDFKIFRERRQLKGIEYSKISNTVESALKNGVAEAYCQFRQYIKANSLITRLKGNLDSFDIEETAEKIEQCCREFNDYVKLEVPYNNHADRLLKLFGAQQEKVTDNLITALAVRINEEENRLLLVKLNDGRWWNPVYWINYSRNKRQEEEKRREYGQREQQIMEELFAYAQVARNFISKLEFLNNVFDETERQFILKLALSREPLTPYLTVVRSALGSYESFRAVAAKVSHLSQENIRILAYAWENSSDREHYKRLLQWIPEFSILLEMGDIEKENRTDLEKYQNFSLLRNEIDTLMKEKQKLVPELVIKKWDNSLWYTLEYNKAREKELKRQANKKRQLWPLRRCIAEFSDILLELFPCWLLSPETVSEILPLKKGIFDMIIFDEASQLFVESAIPAIYRSSSIVIAGDDKQLKPTSVFMVRIQGDEEVEDMETAAALEEESLLDLAKVNYDYVQLNYHYRSRYDELINFSNYAFYNGRLEVSPNLVRSDTEREKPIERILVQGTWIGRENRAEAEKVVELVENILKNRKENETVGIITFNINQKDLIDDMLEDRASEDAEFKRLYHEETAREQGNEDVSIFVKNIENVQGDERDIVIFSTAYAKNEKGRLSVNFGSLSQDGGENRLNVAVSRAKKKIYLVTSFEPEELEVESVKNQGPKLFKKYLQYAREAAQGDKREINDMLKDMLESELAKKPAAYDENGLEGQVSSRLMELGYEVDGNVGVSGYRLDLAVYDREAGKYILGIECDKSPYMSSDKARERDVHRLRYLEARGWRMTRVWSRDWWNDWRKEVERIAAILKAVK